MVTLERGRLGGAGGPSGGCVLEYAAGWQRGWPRVEPVGLGLWGKGGCASGPGAPWRAATRQGIAPSVASPRPSHSAYQHRRLLTSDAWNPCTDMAKMSSTLAAESKQYATRAKDLHRQVRSAARGLRGCWAVQGCPGGPGGTNDGWLTCWVQSGLMHGGMPRLLAATCVSQRACGR